MCDRITYCDIVECCKECPKYGDDCDGDKRNDELISRADAIEAVRFDTFNTLNADERELAINRIPSAEPSLKAIKRQIDEHWYLEPPSAEAVQGWIPISDKLPPVGEDVLATDGEICSVLSLIEGYCWEDEYGHWAELYDFIAWMPLPTPYKGGDDE